MIDLYAMGSPNVAKIFIALEEMELAYSVQVVDLTKGENFALKFMGLSPTAKVPVIVDHDTAGGKPHSVFESGAILLYLAEKTGRFLASGPIERSDAVQWLMMQMANVGPNCGQFVHFSRYAPQDQATYALARYKTIVRNTLDVIERRLGNSPFIGGEEYTVADMAFLPWVHPVDFYFGDGTSEEYPKIKHWADHLVARPAVAKALELTAELRKRLPSPTSAPPEVQDRLFGRGAYSRV